MYINNTLWRYTERQYQKEIQCHKNEAALASTTEDAFLSTPMFQSHCRPLRENSHWSIPLPGLHTIGKTELLIPIDQGPQTCY